MTLTPPRSTSSRASWCLTPPSISKLRGATSTNVHARTGKAVLRSCFAAFPSRHFQCVNEPTGIPSLAENAFAVSPLRCQHSTRSTQIALDAPRLMHPRLHDLWLLRHDAIRRTDTINAGTSDTIPSGAATQSSGASPSPSPLPLPLPLNAASGNASAETILRNLAKNKNAGALPALRAHGGRGTDKAQASQYLQKVNALRMANQEFQSGYPTTREPTHRRPVLNKLRNR